MDPYIEFKAYLFMIPVVFHLQPMPLKIMGIYAPIPKGPEKIKGFS